MTNETAKKVLIEKQGYFKTQIKKLEAKINAYEEAIEVLEAAIDEIDEAETEAFNKDRG